MNIGENAMLRVSLVQRHITNNNWNDFFKWITGGGIYICGSSGGLCVSEIKENFRMRVTKQIKHRDQNDQIDYIFEITIVQSDYNDDGIYFLEISGKNSCTILRVNVTVRDTPICSAIISRDYGHLRTSCRWLPWGINDEMQLTANNQTLQRYRIFKNHVLITNSETTSILRNNTIILSATVLLQDAFDENGIPDSCHVSTADFEFVDRCTFPVFTSPKTNEINVSGGEALFTCCIDSEYEPTLWWYYNTNTVIKVTEQMFTIHLDTSAKGSGDGKKLVIFICGEENDDGLTSFQIGKLVLNLGCLTGVTLSWRIELRHQASGAPNGEGTCTRSYNITVTANPNRHGCATQGAILKTNDKSSQDQRELSFTSAINAQSDILSPTHDKCSSVFCSFRTVISLVVVVVISLLLHVVTCIRNCRRGRESRESSEDNQIIQNNPQIILTSGENNDTETHEMTSLSSNMTCSAAQNTCRQQDATTSCKKKHGSMECNVPKRVTCSESVIAIYQNLNKTTIDEEAYETFEKHVPQQSESPREDISSLMIYQNLDNNAGEYYSLVDNGKCIGDVTNIQTVDFVGDRRNTPDSGIQQETNGEYVNSVTFQDNTDSMYAVPDKPTRSATIGNSQSVDRFVHGCASYNYMPSRMASASAVTTALGTEYDCLRRPEIEQHIGQY